MPSSHLSSNHLSSSNLSRVWIFDLDDTLHNASAHIFPVMNRAMTQYIMDNLALDEPDAYKLRQHYWRIYGATLKGLMRHHGTDPYHFLLETHRLMNFKQEMVIQVKRLRHMLQSLSGRKVVFTNAPRDYAMRVLDLLGIRAMIEPLAVRPKAFEFRRFDDGLLLHSIPLGEKHEQQHGWG